MVNKAVEEMELLHHGEPTWTRIKERALPVTVAHVARRAEGSDHDEFLIRWTAQAA